MQKMFGSVFLNYLVLGPLQDQVLRNKAHGLAANEKTEFKYPLFLNESSYSLSFLTACLSVEKSGLSKGSFEQHL